jgi:hypothetical protein
MAKRKIDAADTHRYTVATNIEHDSGVSARRVEATT